MPEDCAKPSCSSSQDAFNAAMSLATRSPAKSSPSIAQPCPLNRESLGHFSWSVLHTVAAHFPDRPTPAETAAATSLITSFSILYPCQDCAADFRKSLSLNPPHAETRQALSVYICDLHNEVNDKLGKPTFPCTLSSLDSRWRDGGKRCNVDPDDTPSSSFGTPPP